MHTLRQLRTPLIATAVISTLLFGAAITTQLLSAAGPVTQPVVATLIAYKVTSNSASLAAYVATDYYSTQTGGLSGDAYIEWGTDATLAANTEDGRYTKTFSPGVGANIDAFLTGLAPSTTYYYRGVFKDTSGKTTKGEIFSFKTKAQATAVSTSNCPTIGMPSVELATGDSGNFGGGGIPYLSDGSKILRIPTGYEETVFILGASQTKVITPIQLPAYRSAPVGYKPGWGIFQGQRASILGDTVTEFSISQCPGVIETRPSDPDCYWRNTSTDANKISASPGASLTQDNACYTPNNGKPWYLNVQWSYTSCAGNPCGSSLKITSEPVFSSGGNPSATVCPQPEPNSIARSLIFGAVREDKMNSKQISYYPVPSPPNPASTVAIEFTQGQSGSILPSGTVETEFSVSKCPGVIDKSIPQCYYKNTFVLTNKIIIYTDILPQYGFTSQESIGDRGCFAPSKDSSGVPQQYYVNVRWTFPTCSFGAGQCGFSMQWAQGSNF